jgi:ribonuclease D
MYHFKEKVCLIQIAAHNINVVIDPLVVKDLSPLKPIFKRRDIRKIFHGADYDVRSLFRDFRITINNLFDTELACRFLGFSETGLEAVLKNKFDVALNKKYQRKDWSKRPLPPDMIAYAAKDAGYLLPLARSLKAELEERGRLWWVLEECEYLSKVRPNTNNTGPLYMHFKGAGKLNPRSLAVLETVLQLRREIAQKKDKSLFRIFSSRSLLDLAEKNRDINPETNQYVWPINRRSNRACHDNSVKRSPRVSAKKSAQDTACGCRTSKGFETMARPTGEKACHRSRSDMHQISYERNCSTKTTDTIRFVGNKRDEKLAKKRIRPGHIGGVEASAIA